MEKDARTCFFCEKRRAGESSNYYMNLKRKIPDDNITKKSNKNIITKIVEVPRCPRCKSIHDIGFKTTVLAGIVIGPLWFWYVLFVNNELFASICEEDSVQLQPLFFRYKRSISSIISGVTIPNVETVW